MLQNKKKGVLINFIGLDFTGKSTLANLLYNHLLNINSQRDILLTKEPGGTPAGVMIREILKTQHLARMAEMFLFLADRSEHYYKLKDALDKNTIIISDRAYHDSCAYQYSSEEIVKNMSFETLLHMNRLAMHYLEPDYLFYCESSLENIKNRMELRKGNNASEWNNFEQMDFLAKVKDTFEMVLVKGVFKTTKLVRVNTNGTTEDSFRQVLDNLKNI